MTECGVISKTPFAIPCGRCIHVKTTTLHDQVVDNTCTCDTSQKIILLCPSQDQRFANIKLVNCSVCSRMLIYKYCYYFALDKTQVHHMQRGLVYNT